jgi:hypothetical protein
VHQRRSAGGRDRFARHDERALYIDGCHVRMLLR